MGGNGKVLTQSFTGGGYTSACDLWSLGVLAYVSLSGKTPFWGSTQEQLTRMKHELYPIEGGCWDNVSAEAKNFIRSLLRFCPRARSATDCWLGGHPCCRTLLQHPWLALRKQEVPTPIISCVLTNLEQFSHMPDFLSLCVASVARQVDHSSLTDIRDVFCLLDSDCDGTLNCKDVEAGFIRAFGRVPDDMASIFSHLNLDGTGTLSYTEFCAAALGSVASRKSLCSGRRLRVLTHPTTDESHSTICRWC